MGMEAHDCSKFGSWIQAVQHAFPTICWIRILAFYSIFIYTIHTLSILHGRLITMKKLQIVINSSESQHAIKWVSEKLNTVMRVNYNNSDNNNCSSNSSNTKNNLSWQSHCVNPVHVINVDQCQLVNDLWNKPTGSSRLEP